MEQAIQHSIFLAEHGGAAPAVAALRELRQRVEQRRGPLEPLLAHIAGTQSNVAREVGDIEARLEALNWLRGFMERKGHVRQGIETMLAIALAHSDADRHDEAGRAYEEALGAARRTGDGAAESTVHRNYGLWLDTVREPGDASAHLLQAVEAARRSDDRVMLGRALVARGIFLQHAGELDDAQEALQEAVSLLPADEPDILFALSHQDAIESHRSCGCGDMSAALTQALRSLILGQIPDDLLQEIHLVLTEDGSPDVKVELLREPTDPELQLLNSVIHQGVATLQAAIRRRGYAH